jgi:hypothetical protein
MALSVICRVANDIAMRPAPALSHRTRKNGAPQVKFVGCGEDRATCFLELLSSRKLIR